MSQKKQYAVLHSADSWGKLQYSKIQDFVVKRGLWKGQDDTLSHADILIEYVKKLESERKSRELREHVELMRAHREVEILFAGNVDHIHADYLHRFIDEQQEIINKIPVNLLKLKALTEKNREIAVEMAELMEPGV